MNKVLILTLLFVPTLSFAAPSVRMLGNKAPTSLSAQTETKVTPTKNTSNTALSRVGTLRVNTKTTGNTGAITSSSSRFPVITPAHSYSSVVSPGTVNTNTGATVAGVDAAAIADAVAEAKEELRQEYYNKSQFTEAVRDAIEDDPRFDAIRLVDPAQAKNRQGQTLPSDYVYIWIEK